MMGLLFHSKLVHGPVQKLLNYRQRYDFSQPERNPSVGNALGYAHSIVVLHHDINDNILIGPCSESCFGLGARKSLL